MAEGTKFAEPTDQMKASAIMVLLYASDVPPPLKSALLEYQVQCATRDGRVRPRKPKVRVEGGSR